MGLRWNISKNTHTKKKTTKKYNKKKDNKTKKTLFFLFSMDNGHLLMKEPKSITFDKTNPNYYDVI